LQLLSAVEQLGREINCCRITLEVLENNHRARRVYQQFGFESNGDSFSFLFKSIDPTDVGEHRSG
jgi:RimJ/RimL family protein N-acetyltransferase